MKRCITILSVDNHRFRVQVLPHGSAADRIGIGGGADQQDRNRLQACIHAQFLTDLIVILPVQGHGGRGNDLDAVSQG